MILKALLPYFPGHLIEGSDQTEVTDLQLDSRKINQGSLFIAVKGVDADGHQYIEKAIELGAKSIVCEVMPSTIHDGISYLQTEDARKATAMLADAFYDHPSKKLRLVAITGTNGKTTTVTLLHALFRKLGYNVGALTTIENKINEEIIPTKLTTPDAITTNKLLAEMVDKNCQYCFMEASSHAIVQERVGGLHFTGAIFSNISHDHLDYHGTFKEYIFAKKKLFDDLPKSAFALVNKDDKRWEVMLQNTKASQHTFALNNIAEFQGKVIENTFEGLEVEFNGHRVWLQLIGDFNAYNLLSVYATAQMLGEDPMVVLQVLSELPPAHGRFEQMMSPEGIRGVIDYAHTPDALENVLKTIDNIRHDGERIITVVGTGGNRDKEKRPVMANTAANYSDHVILTSDNPRDEEPEDILEDMMKGITPTQWRRVTKITDRAEAIKMAYQLATPRDIILIAGKGHENYQEIKGVRHPFDDKEVLLKIFNLK